MSENCSAADGRTVTDANAGFKFGLTVQVTCFAYTHSVAQSDVRANPRGRANPHLTVNIDPRVDKTPLTDIAEGTNAGRAKPFRSSAKNDRVPTNPGPLFHIHPIAHHHLVFKHNVPCNMSILSHQNARPDGSTRTDRRTSANNRPRANHGTLLDGGASLNHRSRIHHSPRMNRPRRNSRLRGLREILHE